MEISKEKSLKIFKEYMAARHMHPPIGKFIIMKNIWHQYARIHKSDCGHARKSLYETNHTYWSDYFETFADAEKFARSKYDDVSYCAICKTEVSKYKHESKNK
jgi:hypothetical protein